MFTLRQFYKHLKRASDTFMKKCPEPQYRNALRTMHYKIKIDSRLRVKAGEASTMKINGTRSLYMRVSKLIMERSRPEEQFQTISHELAHLLEFLVHGESNHKARWKQLHMWMGGDAKRCHDIRVDDVSNRRTRILVVDSKLNKKYYLRKSTYAKMKMNLSLSNVDEPGRYTSKLVRVSVKQIKNA